MFLCLFSIISENLLRIQCIFFLHTYVYNYHLSCFYKHYNSLSNVAYFYYNGIEIDKNVKFALELWERLAENNNDNALYYLGEHYKNINDKIKNKTKKELLDEINKLNLINHK